MTETLMQVDSVSDIELAADELAVAFASMDGDMIDQHFGSARAFWLYIISASRADLVSCIRFGQEKMDGNEDKLKPKLAWLVGADIVYCGSVGGSASRQLIALGVNPLKVTGGPDLEELIEDLQAQLTGTPEPWLANILRRKGADTSASRFDDMEDEGWDE